MAFRFSASLLCRISFYLEVSQVYCDVIVCCKHFHQCLSTIANLEVEKNKIENKQNRIELCTTVLKFPFSLGWYITDKYWVHNVTKLELRKNLISSKVKRNRVKWETNKEKSSNALEDWERSYFSAIHELMEGTTSFLELQKQIVKLRADLSVNYFEKSNQLEEQYNYSFPNMFSKLQDLKLVGLVDVDYFAWFKNSLASLVLEDCLLPLGDLEKCGGLFYELKNLKFLSIKNVSYPKFEVERLPNSLIELNLKSCNFLHIPTLPESITKLMIINCSIELPTLPQSLRSLILKCNSFQIIPSVPDRLSYFVCLRNYYLNQLPNFPDFLETCIFYDNGELVSNLKLPHRWLESKRYLKRCKVADYCFGLNSDELLNMYELEI